VRLEKRKRGATASAVNAPLQANIGLPLRNQYTSYRALVKSFQGGEPRKTEKARKPPPVCAVRAPRERGGGEAQASAKPETTFQRAGKATPPPDIYSPFPCARPGGGVRGGEAEARR